MISSEEAFLIARAGSIWVPSPHLFAYNTTKITGQMPRYQIKLLLLWKCIITALILDMNNTFLQIEINLLIVLTRCTMLLKWTSHQLEELFATCCRSMPHLCEILNFLCSTAGCLHHYSLVPLMVWILVYYKLGSVRKRENIVSSLIILFMFVVFISELLTISAKSIAYMGAN